jgi:hypothetical protein
MTSSVEADDLNHELKQVRKGKGVRHPGLVRRVGPTLRLVCGIGSSSNDALAKAKISSTITALSDDMDKKLFRVLQGELGLLADCNLSTLGKRQEWLGADLVQSPKTIRNWGLQAAQTAASILANRQNESETSKAADSPYVFDVPAPTEPGKEMPLRVDRIVRTSFYKANRLESIHVQRTITSLANGLTELSTRLRIKKNVRTEVRIDHCLHCDVSDVESTTAGFVNFRARLPRPLIAGDQHTYEYRTTPVNNSCEADPHVYFWTTSAQPDLHIRVHFDKSLLPSRIWRVDGLEPIMTPGNLEVCNPAEIDAFSLAEVFFDATLPNKAYGLAWEWPQGSAL